MIGIIQLCLLLFIACEIASQADPPDQKTLDFYLQQSSSTNPYNYNTLYRQLPDNPEDLCRIIKKQLIHPLEASEMKDILPDGRFYEDADFPYVDDMLAELMKRDSSGLTTKRRAQDRLVVACHHHGLLFASIMREKGVPVRIRAGFARYFEERANVRFGHVICEVWDAENQKWILVDPDRSYIAMEAEKFEFSPDAWKRLRNGEKFTVNYVSALSKGLHAILHILMQDLSCVLGMEKSYWHEPEFLFDSIKDISELMQAQLLVFDSIASLLSRPDQSLHELQDLYARHSFLHPETLEFSEWYTMRTGKDIEDFYTEFE